MPLLRVEAEKLSNNQLISGIIEEIIDKDEMFALLPFVGINGKAYVYDRENTLASADFLDPNDVIAEGGSTFTEVVSKLRILAGDVDVDKFLQETMSDTNDQKATQIGAKAKGVAKKFQQTMVTGDSVANPKEFDGFAKLLTAPQTLTAGANGAALSLTMLDELLDAVPNGADCLVMRSGTIRAYRALLYATGGIVPAMIEVENFGTMLAHNGVPIVKNDFVPAAVAQGTATNTCSVYAVRMNEQDGLHGLFGGSDAGMRVEDIGTVQNKDATRTRIKWYAGLALKSTRSLAAIKGITNV